MGPLETIVYGFRIKKLVSNCFEVNFKRKYGYSKFGAIFANYEDAITFCMT